MAGIGGRGDRRQWVWLRGFGLLLVVASSAYAAVQLLHRQSDASTTAGLLGLPVGVSALVVSVMALRQRPEGGLAGLARGWASTLARQVQESEERAWRQLLGDDTQRINLTFTLRTVSARTAVAPAGAGRLFGGGSAVPDVSGYYLRTLPRRLVVTGAAGAGKTVLVLELMLALLDERGEDDPVPVRLSMAEWDTAVPLPDRLARHLVDVYDWPADMAAELVRQRRVLPVLDGLDEMDRTRPDGTPSPDAPRARAALDALNAYQEGRVAGPVVLTCRTAHYEALTGGARLLDAAHVDIDSVTAPAAKAYLLQRITDAARWQPVLEILDRYPSGTLATTLSTPWRLCLAATVYARDGDPADLLHHVTPRDLDDYLLARFIPAVIALHPHHGYDASHVRRWLTHLAAHLNTPAPGPGPSPQGEAGPGTDLVLHQLWPLAGRRPVRTADALLTTLAALLPLPLSRPSFDGPAFVSALAFVGGCYAARAQVNPPRRLSWPRLHTPTGRRQLADGLKSGLKLGLLGGFSLLGLSGLGLGLTLLQYALDFGVPIFVSGLVVGGFAGGLAGGLTGEPTTTARPRAIIRSDLVAGLVIGLVTMFAFCWTGFVMGLTIGFTVALTIGAESGRRYLVFLLCSRRRLPKRLGVFLDWACTAGIMRLAGASYQFRHRELQQWLTHHSSPPPV
ncbi:NACHT domain-containing protein [Actinacidiphila oryziradicis]|uniref:NACHT domain-containing protein n=1 Tax=Actinacidiphila oryziradicis TaxID=2571141 RepID=A0A4U0RW44_9ACTN|nr:NACHT domain-containing protein [Actinacidiphila oryziradicis]TJZ99040.1 NACHT domain-containing protein [Actinacidiphila oryziradicis]